MKGQRINEYDVLVVCSIEEKGRLNALANGLVKADLKVYNLSSCAIQVSFDEQPELREQLPPIGTTYPIKI